MGRSAGVVTAAAAVMVGVFSVFGMLSGLEMKQLGVGLATAILLDATLVRGVLLPAVLTMLGRRAHTGPRGCRAGTTEGARGRTHPHQPPRRPPVGGASGASGGGLP